MEAAEYNNASMYRSVGRWGLSKEESIVVKESVNVLQIMGCTSEQYASMEWYLVRKAQVLSERDSRLIVVYENKPKSEEFQRSFRESGGILEQGSFGSFRDCMFFGGLKALITDWEVDIVHAYFTPTCHYVSITLHMMGFTKIVRSAANMPFGVVAGGLAKDGKPRKRTRLKHRILSLLFRKILCRSDGVANAFLQMGVDSSRVTVTDGGCDTKRYCFSPQARMRLRRELGIDEDELVLAASCRLTKVKRVDRLVCLVAEMSRGEKVKMRLLIVGDGPDRSHLELLANERGVAHCVQFLGQRDDLEELYSAFDVFCLASEAEGMSNSILEAMSCGLPVLATDIPPNYGIVQSGRNGFLLSFDNLGEFERCVEKLSHASVRQTMGAFGRGIVVSKYGLESRIEKELKVYEELVGQA